MELVEFCQTLGVADYKKMIQTREAELGPTLFDFDLGLEALKKVWVQESVEAEHPAFLQL